MVSARRSALWMTGIATLIAAAAACQTLAGIEDKELDPSFGSGGTGGTGGTAGTGGNTEAGTDAPNDVEAEAADAGEDVTDAGIGARPPGRPVGEPTPSGEGKELTFAVRRFYLGTVDPATDLIELEAWRQFGFDYDGECTTKGQSEQNASGTCRMPANANAMSLEDGDDCRDNTGGHLLAEVLSFVDQSFEKKEHQGTLTAAGPTIILAIHDLDDGPDDPYAPATLYVSAPKDGGMLWDGNDVLEVDRDSLVDGGLGAPKYEMPNGYMKNHVWVSGDFKGPPMVVPMMVLNVIAPVPAETATMMMELDEAHLQASCGVFSGALDTLTLEPLLRVGMLEATQCNEAMTQLGMSMFLPNRDLARTPDFVSPSDECGLMSIAVGLEFMRVQPPITAVDVPPSASSCDAGTD